MTIKKDSKYYELCRMMDVSNSFFSISEIKNKSVFDYENVLSIPTIVNATFSLEIALKFLYYANNINDKQTGHKITKLYNNSKKYGLEEYLKSGFSDNEISEALKELDKAFENFRYIYEYKGVLKINQLLIRDFICNVNKYCNIYFEEKVKK